MKNLYPHFSGIFDGHLMIRQLAENLVNINPVVAGGDFTG